MWRATLRGLLVHRLRVALTALAIVLGTAFMSGTYVLTDTIDHAFAVALQTAYSGVDVVVRSGSTVPSQQGSERPTVPASLLAVVRGVPGVRTAVGAVSGYAQLVARDGSAISTGGAPTLGVAWEPIGTGVRIGAGRPPRGPGQVAIDAATARRYGFRVGDRIRILLQGPARTFEISGIVRFGTADNLAGATLAVFDLPTAQQLLGKPGRLDAIDVVGQPGVSVGTLRERVQGALPPGYQALPAATVAQENARQFQQALGFFKTALLVFALVALFVGAFIIFNTFAIIVAQRTRELALLRAIGATGRQVTASVLTEAGLTGLAASAVGVVAGLGVAVGLQGLLKAFGIDLPATGTQVLPRTIVVSLVTGTLVTLVAAIGPARHAARVAPVEALREADPGAETPGGRRRTLLGAALAASGLAALFGGLLGRPANAAAIVGAGAALVFLAVAMLSPLVARPLALGIGAPLAGITRVTGRLGRGNAMRSPRRTAATAAALMIGLGLVSFVSIVAASVKASVNATLERTLRADLILTSSSFAGFSPQLAADLRRLPQVGVVSEVRFGQARVGGGTVQVVGIDPATIERVVAVDVAAGSLRSLAAGGIMVDQTTADRHRWKVGATIATGFGATGTRSLPIVGIYRPNALLGRYAVSLSTFAANAPDALDSAVLVDARPGVSPAAAHAAVVRAARAYPNVTVNDQASYRRQQAAQIDRLLALITALLMLSVAIAFLGIVNTLGLSVLERSREIGLLRAVGMTRRQVRGMVRAESIIVAVFGALLGVAVGVLFGWAMVRAMLTELAIPVGQLALYVVLAAALGIVAAVWPARRAARVDILRAVTTE